MYSSTPRRWATKFPVSASGGSVGGADVLGVARGPALALGAGPGAHAASVVARWSLRKGAGEPASGLTLLVLRKVLGAWRIVHDASL